MTRKRVVASFDIGQLRDYTALTIVEEWAEETTFGDLDEEMLSRLPIDQVPKGKLWPDLKEMVWYSKPTYECRHIERLPLNTDYPTVAQFAADVVNNGKLYVGDTRPTLLIDETGVGRGIAQFMTSMGLSPLAYTITGGHTVSYPSTTRIHAPKIDLVYSAIMALQSGRLSIAASLEHAKTLRAELLAFEVNVTAAGNQTFAASTSADWRNVGRHDDLVLSLSMALHYLTRWVPMSRTDLDASKYPVVAQGGGIHGGIAGALKHPPERFRKSGR